MCIIVIAIAIFGFVLKHLIKLVLQQDIKWVIVKHDSWKYFRVIQIFKAERNGINYLPEKVKQLIHCGRVPIGQS
jgi:hypothetical protein